MGNGVDDVDSERNNEKSPDNWPKHISSFQPKPYSLAINSSNMNEEKHNIDSIDNFRLLTQLDTKVDYLTSEIKEMKDSTNQRVYGLEMRAEKMERQHAYWKGAIAVIYILFATFALYIFDYLRK